MLSACLQEHVRRTLLILVRLRREADQLQEQAQVCCQSSASCIAGSHVSSSLCWLTWWQQPQQVGVETCHCPAMQGAAMQANSAIETLHAATRSGTVSLAQASANVDRCRLAMHPVSSEPEQGALTRFKQAVSGQRK